MSELRDRLERLAARGSRRGADAVLGAALRGAPNDQIGVVPDFDGPDLPVIDDEVPFVSPDLETRRRGRFGTVVSAFGIAALLGVGMLAVTAMFGSGGASSPEGAVRQLADAISHKDALAAVDVLSPGEVRAARDTVSKATRRAADLKLVNDASEPFAGVDLSVTHLELSTEKLADGYVKVIVTSGEISASTHKAGLSKLLQEANRDNDTLDATEKADLARLASDSDLPTFVVTVRHDGGWYVSPAYTAFEYAREADDGPPADFGSAKTADIGADTPEGAVSDALHALQQGNWNRLMELAPPDELPVYDYRKWLNEAAADARPEFTVDKLVTSADVNGDKATVKLEASGTAGSGSDQSRWQVGGACPSSTYDWYGSGEEDASNSHLFCVAGDLGRAVPFGLLMGGSDVTSAASGSISVEVVRENGRWFVSPVSSILKGIDSLIEHIDQRTVYTMLGLAYQLPTDGTITLDQPFTVPVETGFLSSAVLAFEGTKGQDVIGEISKRSGYMSGEIYTADGKDIGYVDFSTVQDGYASPVALPDSGSYRLIVNGASAKDVKLTLWDTKNAPKGLEGSFDGGIEGPGEVCTTKGNETSCSSSGVSYPETPSNPSGGVYGSACEIKNNQFVCPGQAATPICPENDSADDGSCIPRDIAKSIASSGAGSSSGSAGSGSSGSVTETTFVGPVPTVVVAPTVGVATTVP